MIPPGSRFKRRLTDDEMDRIRFAAKAYGSKGGFHALWSILLGMPWAEAEARQLQADVRDYAIPADQDRQIQRILSVPPSKATRKRWSRQGTGMVFLFWGPATYDEDDA